MKEFVITGRFHFDNKATIVAKDEKEALMIARRTLRELCKDMLSDSDNVFINIESKREITPDEVRQDIQDGILKESEVKPKDLKQPKSKTKKTKKDEDKTKNRTSVRKNRK